MTLEELQNKIKRQQEIKAYIEEKELALGNSTPQDAADKAACDAQIAVFQQAVDDLLGGE